MHLNYSIASTRYALLSVFLDSFLREDEESAQPQQHSAMIRIISAVYNEPLASNPSWRVP